MTPVEIYERGELQSIVEGGERRVVVQGGGEKDLVVVTVTGDREDGGSLVVYDSSKGGRGSLFRLPRGKVKQVGRHRFKGV